eukprot:tig00000403_g319.t1
MGARGARYVHTKLAAVSREAARVTSQLLESDSEPGAAPEDGDRDPPPAPPAPAPGSPDRAPAALPPSPQLPALRGAPAPDSIPEGDEEEGYFDAGGGVQEPPEEPAAGAAGEAWGAPAPASPPQGRPGAGPGSPPILPSSPPEATFAFAQGSLAPSSPPLSAPSTARSLHGPAPASPPPPAARQGEEAKRRVQDVYKRLGAKYAAPPQGTKFRAGAAPGPRSGPAHVR